MRIYIFTLLISILTRHKISTASAGCNLVQGFSLLKLVIASYTIWILWINFFLDFYFLFLFFSFCLFLFQFVWRRSRSSTRWSSYFGSIIYNRWSKINLRRLIIIINLFLWDVNLMITIIQLFLRFLRFILLLFILIVNILALIFLLII